MNRTKMNSTNPYRESMDLNSVPVKPAERIVVVDILRGWAILGMILVNMTVDVGWSHLFVERFSDPLNSIVLKLLEVLASGKFVSLFSILFGFGFTIQMSRMEGQDKKFLLIYIRRLIVLFFIGVIFTILWGDHVSQLEVYALLGFSLIPFRKLSPRVLLLIVVIFFLIPNIFLAYQSTQQSNKIEHTRQFVPEQLENSTEQSTWAEQRDYLLSKGSMREFISYQFLRKLEIYSHDNYYLRILGFEFPLLLFGFYVGRKRILLNGQKGIPSLFKSVLWLFFLGMLLLSVPHIVDGKILYRTFKRLSDPVIGCFYATGIIFLCNLSWGKRFFYPLSYVGRLALTNYLLQGLIYGILFYGWGSGLYGKMSPSNGVLVAFLIFIIQLLFSTLWLQFFQFGPFEWFWRGLSYGKWPAMRIKKTKNYLHL